MRIGMKKQTLLPLFLIGIVFISGCVGQQPTTTKEGKGLSIQSFSPDFDEVRSGEEITLSSLIENVGESDATDISVQLFGLNLNEWDLVSPDDETQTLNILRKADTSLELPGESYEFNWNLESPSGLRVDNTYTANIRTYYIYQTSVVTTLRFMSYDYMKSLPEKDFEAAKSSTGVVQTSVSAAPVSGSINVGNRPLIVYGDGDTYSIQLIIENVGNGNPFNKDADYPGYGGSLNSDDLYSVYVNIETDLDLDCSNTLGNAKSGLVRLSRGSSKTLFCTATIPSMSSLGNKKDYTVTANLEYGYFIDDSTKVKVLKSEYGGTSGGGTTGWDCVAGSTCSVDDDCPPGSSSKPTRDCRNGLCCYR
jgi:hypothetical protein